MRSGWRRKTGKGKGKGKGTGNGMDTGTVGGGASVMARVKVGTFLMRYLSAESCGRERDGRYSGWNGDSSAALLRARRR